MFPSLSSYPPFSFLILLFFLNFILSINIYFLYFLIYIFPLSFLIPPFLSPYPPLFINFSLSFLIFIFLSFLIPTFRSPYLLLFLIFSLSFLIFIFPPLFPYIHLSLLFLLFFLYFLTFFSYFNFFPSLSLYPSLDLSISSHKNISPLQIFILFSRLICVFPGLSLPYTQCLYCLVINNYRPFPAL